MKVIFCIPGREFSDRWVRSWTDTLIECGRSGIDWAMSMQYDPVVYYARNRVLGGDNTQGRLQKPFQGTVDYDRMVWIDSDIVWKGSDVMRLLSHDMDVVSGCYPMADGNSYPIVENLDYDRLLEQGTFAFMQREDLESRTDLFKANYVGFGFVSIARGVIEQMEYPWFRPRWVEMDQFCDFTAEDVGFCWSALEKHIDIWVDPSIRLGHLKPAVIT